MIRGIVQARPFSRGAPGPLSPVNKATTGKLLGIFIVAENGLNLIPAAGEGAPVNRAVPILGVRGAEACGIRRESRRCVEPYKWTGSR